MTRKFQLSHKSEIEYHLCLSRHKTLGACLSGFLLLIYKAGLKHKGVWMPQGLVAKEGNLGEVVQCLDCSGKRSQKLSSLAFSHFPSPNTQNSEGPAQEAIPTLVNRAKNVFLELSTQKSYHPKTGLSLYLGRGVGSAPQSLTDSLLLKVEVPRLLN